MKGSLKELSSGNWEKDLGLFIQKVYIETIEILV